jgi:hypothetical protein
MHTELELTLQAKPAKDAKAELERRSQALLAKIKAANATIAQLDNRLESERDVLRKGTERYNAACRALVLGKDGDPAKCKQEMEAASHAISGAESVRAEQLVILQDLQAQHAPIGRKLAVLEEQEQLSEVARRGEETLAKLEQARDALIGAEKAFRSVIAELRAGNRWGTSEIGGSAKRVAAELEERGKYEQFRKTQDSTRLNMIQSAPEVTA